MAINKTVEFMRSKLEGCKPKVGIILGSGLGQFADNVEDQIIFSYDELPGFPDASVKGHAGRIILEKFREQKWPFYRVVPIIMNRASQT